MSQPSFLTDGYTPRRTDARWPILAKILGALQSRVGALSANDPRRTDTRRVLLQKILCAFQGVAYTG